MSALLANTAFLGAVLGVVAPLAIALVQQPHWSTKVRKYVADGCAAVIGVLTCAVTGKLGNGTVDTATILAIVAASRTAYAGLWRKTTVTATVEAVSTVLTKALAGRPL